MTSPKRVLITGCSNNSIGSALALQFQRKGWHVFATARNPVKMSALENIPHITLLPLDVTKSEQLTAVVESIKNEGDGGLDVVINNAAVSHFTPLLDTDIDAAKEVFETNLWSPLKIIKSFVPMLREKGSGGMVVNISSIAGYVSVPYLGIYASSKRSLDIISETLRLELSPFNVKVLTVVTGPTKSNGGQSGLAPFKCPEGSVYSPIEEIIASRARGEDGAPREDTESYARKVVDDIINGKTGKIWHGAGAGTLRYASCLAPQGVLDKELLKGNGLDVLTEVVAKGGK